ncbi:sensor histidine kinase [Anaeromicropila populeti]|uniref:histidine kinase n=1 Tax=Anaeromicropila populeti TaxID=37658 RepID=A0A1I6HS18_9FIRM|nr:HAMP domain-containing sensor histidine kinase [Anaeromicropila populeti]SFR57197.1 Signal transduction histidine kinase [Anaeromicropila populeti]
MFKSIKTRLTVTICGILFCMFAVQMAANFLFAERYYTFQKMKMVQKVYNEIQEATASTQESIINILEEKENDNNLEFILADENLEFLYTNKNLMPKDKKPDNRNSQKYTDIDLKKYTNDFCKDAKPILDRTGSDYDKIRLFGIVQQNETIYHLVIRVSVKSISDDMTSTNFFLLYISIFALMAGVIIVYIIAKQIAKPIEDINQVAIHVSNLDFSVRAPVNNLKDELGSLAANINIMTDKLENNILTLKKTNEQLEKDNEYMNKLDEMRKEFIANISHELKTPLSILTGYAEMLNNDVPGIDRNFYYETILDETHKMDILIKRLLNLASLENKIIDIQMEEINLAELAEHVIQKNHILFKDKGIIWEFHTLPCGMVKGDPVYLEEAINNYISNAIHHTPRGNKIIVKVEPEGDRATLSVYNEGTAISEEHIDKIWNNFYRIDKARKRTEDHNLGMGLHIVKTIMSAHHGECGVRNKERGIEFWLSL